MGLSLQAVAFWITTISAAASTAYVMSYGVLLLCVLLTLLVNNAGMCYILHMIDPPTWFVLVRTLFKVIPGFNYSVLFFYISERSGNHYDIETNNWVTGNGFKYSDFFKDSEGDIPEYFAYSVIRLFISLF